MSPEEVGMVEVGLVTTRLQAVFVESLGLDPDTAGWSTLAYRGVPQWDSVAHLQLVDAIEDEFGIALDTEDVIAMSSFSRVREIILAKYAQGATEVTAAPVDAEVG